MERSALSEADIYRNEFDLEYHRSRPMLLFMKLGLDYKVIPPFFRNLAGRLVHSKSTLQRDFPIDDKVDSLEPNDGLWPAEFACCFTHDIDTGYCFNVGLDLLLEVERRQGIRSTNNLVPKSRDYKIDYNRVASLQDEGFEFGCHGLHHDGRFAFISPKERESRIKIAKDALETGGVKVKGFRAPWLNRTRDMIPLLEKHGYLWDSTSPDTDPTTIGYEGTGCSTVYPFHPLIESAGKYIPSRIVELPITIPQDWTLIHSLKYSPSEVFELWKRKADYIQSIGGLALFLTHPAEYGMADRRYLPIYEKIIEYVKGKNPFIGTCTQICDEFIRRRG